MRARNRGAFTLIELLTVMAIIGLLISIMTPPLSRAREMARRGLCLANLRGIGQGCITYALGSRSHFPYAGQPDPGFAIGDAWDWDGTSTYTFGGVQKTPATDPKPVSNTRHLWKLVHMQIADTRTFICPSDGVGGEPFLPAVLKPTELDRSSLSDVQNRSQFSYAFQYQGPAGSSAAKRTGWTTTSKDDPKLVILADTSPAWRAKNPEAVIPADDHTFEWATSNSGTTFSAGKAFVDTLASINNITWNLATAKASYSLGNPEDVRALNSPNHRGDGQNVVRLDGSGDFATDPWAGAYMDNIWTVQDPGEYSQTSPDSTKMLDARMRGLYDETKYNQAALLQNWVAHDLSKTRYPDSFLVP